MRVSGHPPPQRLPAPTALDTGPSSKPLEHIGIEYVTQPLFGMTNSKTPRPAPDTDREMTNASKSLSPPRIKQGDSKVPGYQRSRLHLPLRCLLHLLRLHLHRLVHGQWLLGKRQQNTGYDFFYKVMSATTGSIMLPTHIYDRLSPCIASQ